MWTFDERIAEVLPVTEGLPAPLTSFIGRTQEIAELRHLVATRRLVNMTGAAGVGKTRLALRCAELSRRSFGDGVVVVELARLSDPDQVARQVALSVGLQTQGADTPEAALVRYLRDKQLLIVMDNCEHVAQACEELISTLLVEASGLHVLATSRHTLGVDGEQVVHIGPLPTPLVDDLETARGLDAVSLFVARASAVQMDFALTEQNWRQVVRLCRRLDGIPLAIELTVAWLSVLTLDEIAGRLDDQLRLLVRGSWTAPRHQRTLEGTIGWSYSLCTESERLLWSRLTIFLGGCDLQSVEKVCTDGPLRTVEVLPTLAALVNKSIVNRDHTASADRYVMLDMLREFGTRTLPGEEREPLRQRHLDHFLAMAEGIESSWMRGARQDLLCHKLNAERGNLFQALDFALHSTRNARKGLRLAGALFPLWLFCGYVDEGRRWLHQALALNQEAGPDRTRALWVCAYAASLQGDQEDSARLAQECEQVALAQGEENALAYMWVVRAGTAFITGDYESANRLHELATAAAGRENAHRRVLVASSNSVSHSLQGKLDDAEALARGALELCDETGETCARVYAAYGLALALWRKENFAGAYTEALRGLPYARSLNDVFGASMLFEVASWAQSRIDPARAAELFGIADTLWSRVGGQPNVDAQPLIADHLACLEHVRAQMQQPVFERAFRRGAAMGVQLDRALGYVLETAEQPAKRPARKVQPSSVLTRREREVAGLVAEGMTDKAIASRLCIAQRTAETHVAHILAKLGLNSRTELAVLMHAE